MVVTEFDFVRHHADRLKDLLCRVSTEPKRFDFNMPPPPHFVPPMEFQGAVLIVNPSLRGLNADCFADTTR
jgi:hypothetical protein